MKVLHVAETIKGGIATYLNDLVPLQQADDAMQVRLLVPVEQRDEVPAIPASSVGYFRRRSRSLGLPALTAALRREVSRDRPDIIHAHSTFAGLITRLLSLTSSSFPPIVYCPHGWAFDRWGSWTSEYVIRAAEVALSSRSAKIVAISWHEYEQAVQIGIAPERLKIVASGLAAADRQAEIAPPTSDGQDRRRKVLFVGRLDRQKGADLLLDAVECLQDAVVLSLIGANVVDRRDKAVARPEHIRELGWKSPGEIDGYIKDCDVVVVPSRWEGFGLVALEAMRMGKPVIASSVGGLKEVVVNGSTGILVPPGDIGELRAAILRPSATELAEMGARGRERFDRNYRIERVHEELRELYAGVLGLQSRTARACLPIGGVAEDRQR